MNLLPFAFKPNRFVTTSLAGRLSYQRLPVGASANISDTPAPSWHLGELFLKPVAVVAVKFPAKKFHCYFDFIF